MFNKDDNTKIQRFELKNKDFYKQYNNISITPFFAVMLNKYYEDKKMQEHFDLDGKIKDYYDRSFEYSIKKQYNNIIDTLYHHGKILINNIEYNLNDFYIVYHDNHKFQLLCIDNQYPNENSEYNKSVKLIDTTAFITLITQCEIKDNTIIINNIDNLNKTIADWDGLLHDKVSETDAILNKKMIGNDEDE